MAEPQNSNSYRDCIQRPRPRHYVDQYSVVPDVIPFTWDFLWADIYELLSPDLLHQVIKGTFKDHLVAWVASILRTSMARPRPRRLWQTSTSTDAMDGDNSKALMKVYLPAIEGMLCALSAFLDFCYLVHQNVSDEATLTAIDAALARYHQERAPNGLCSSITESKHIKAVKQPWRRSRRGNDGGAIDESRFSGIILAKTSESNSVGQHLDLPQLVPLIRCFLYLQDNPTTILISLSSVVKVFPSAIAKFYAPNQSGVRGMLRERIRAVRSWRGGAPRYDCVFVEAARVLLFMSFKHLGVTYPCALVTWFSAIGDEPCPDVGMWMVEPDVDHRGRRVLDIIHIDTILRGASHRYLR
ncbi:hypothetical protein B0H10DRAFT_2176466 [Mycena sp. CBHHK59/15]|nr:hypothetical protein B0H10DRAFT_2176466 [Mycena sp. CBHHK59/15]